MPVTHDSNNYNIIGLKESGTSKVIVKHNFLGLVEAIKYGATGSEARQLTHDYDNYLRIKRIYSDESPTKKLDIALTRDVIGNIRSRTEFYPSSINYSYTFDGMNRLATGENETCVYDALSNILSRGAKTYTYEAVGSAKIRCEWLHSRSPEKVPECPRTTAMAES